MQRVIFFGTPEHGLPTLSALIASSDYRPVAVITALEKNGSPIARLAAEHGIEVLTPETLKNDASFDLISGLAPTLCIVVGYGAIIPGRILAIPPHGFLNVHPSLLPRHRGPSPVQATILHGDTETGVSIMKLDEKMDHGSILAHEAMPVLERDDHVTLSARLFARGAEMLMEVLPRYLSGELVGTPQPHEQATFCKLLKKEDGAMDLSNSALQLERQVRAYRPWPGTFLFWKEKRIKILSVATTHLPTSGSDIFFTDGARLFLNTGDGMLEILTLQPEGKRVMSGAEFARGYLR